MTQKTQFMFTHIFTFYFWKVMFSKITGGRPMIDCGYNFTDKVSGKSVRNYQDRLGRLWLSDGGKWGCFRVKRNI